MKNRLSRDPGVSDPSVDARPVNHVGVLGTGLMGSGIAAAHARSGIRTAMVDVDDARLKDGIERASDVVMSRIKIGRATPQDMANMLAMLSTSTNPVDLRRFRRGHRGGHREPSAEEGGLSEARQGPARRRDPGEQYLDDLDHASWPNPLPHPDRFIGMHFFNPVDRMELVEVIRGEKTSDETVATIVALSKRIRKTPIVVRDCAGFLVNRILLPYMNEALLLLQEGVSMAAIDRAATRFGMPMGPIALTDMVGLGTACYAGKLLAGAYPDRAVTSPILEDMLKAGGADHASALRFWVSKGKQSKPEPNPAVLSIIAKHQTGEKTMDEPEITDRLFFPMLLEATRVLEEGIVREPGDVDMGLILGIGFPPFRGGILRWADTVGAGKIVERLAKYAPLGKRYEPTESLLKLAKSGRDFLSPPQARRRLLMGVALIPNIAKDSCIRLKEIEPMSQAVIIDAIRTPIGRASADKGYFRDVRADELSAHVIEALVKRTGIDPKLVEDVRWGCVQQQGEQGYDIARIAAMIAGLPKETAGVTINRNCASSLQAINDSAMSVAAGCEDIQIAGGVEHMDHIPMTKDYNPSPLLFRRHSEAIMNMGLTAEYLAMKYRIPAPTG